MQSMALTPSRVPLRSGPIRGVRQRGPQGSTVKPLAAQLQEKLSSRSTSTDLPRSIRLREIRTGGGIVGPRLGQGQGQDMQSKLRDLFLPDGFPNSVSGDYLGYQLWTVPTHITGWLSIGLTTSSLLQAVGVSAGPVGTALSAAAIKWIIKDGIGAVGRFIVGGKLGLEFDDDPRRWRMIAEFVTTLGLAMEVATLVYPSYFLALASTGNFAKAVGKGMGKPVFRVIQTHFARSNNVGAVAAKEEIWEVVGQLTGYAASVAMLQALEKTDSTFVSIISVWVVVQASHVAFRWRALKELSFESLNQKRACMLTSAHASGAALPGVVELNQLEPIFPAASSLEPVVHIGCSLHDAFGEGISGHHREWVLHVGNEQAGGETSAEASGTLPQEVHEYLKLYEQEQYILVWRNAQAYILLKDEITATGVLRSIWQAAWLSHQNKQGLKMSGRGEPLVEGGALHDLHTQSLAALSSGYEDFVTKARELNWEIDSLQMKLGNIRVATA